jgi:FkbM family methyltransferase
VLQEIVTGCASMGGRQEWIGRYGSHGRGNCEQMNLKSRLRQLFVGQLWWMGWVPIAQAARPLSRLPVIGRAVQRVPISGEYECRFDGHSLRYMADKRDLLGRDIFWKGLSHFEPGTLHVLKEYIDDQTLFIDVGASTGIYSILALALGAPKVVAFEPIPEIFECLEANLKANAPTDRFVALNAAASSTAQTVEFHVPSGAVFPTSGSLHSGGFRGIDGTLVKVEARLVDEVLDAHGIPETDFERVLIKIDVEGFEVHVLQGMDRIMRSGRALVIFECHPDGPVKELQDVFNKYGYSVGHIDIHGIHLLDRIDTGKTSAGDWNFIAIPANHQLSARIAAGTA